MAKLEYLKDVTTLKLDTDKCTGCTRCIQVCPHEVFVLEGNKAEIADRDACMECGACATNCPSQAISVDSGVGCAAGIILGALRGTEPACDCGDNGSSCG